MMPMLAALYHLSPSDVWALTLDERQAFLDDYERSQE